MQFNWLKEIRRDLDDIGLTLTDVLNRRISRKRMKSFGGFKETKKTTTGVVWSDQRRECNERMKTYWIENKRKKKTEERKLFMKSCLPWS